MMQLLRLLGVEVDWLSPNVLRVDASHLLSHTAPYELVSKMRASVYIMGPLLARLSRAKVALPGGCSFGPRPVNFHIEGLRRMGVEIETVHGEMCAHTKGLVGMEMELPVRSVGATAHLMMAAALAKGETVILNASMEPEVIAVAEFLNRAGARITGVETGVVKIKGVKQLGSPGEFTNIPDRIETGTIAAAAIATRGQVIIEDTDPEAARPVLAKFKETGATIEISGDRVKVVAPSRPRPVDVITAPHPGFPTDMQANMMAVLATGAGVSTITETIYPDRFKHAAEMNRLGAHITVEAGGRAVVRGVEQLTGAPIQGTDLRATAALAVAGMSAEGETLLTGISHLERGYEDFVGKMQSLGADIRAIED